MTNQEIEKERIYPCKKCGKLRSKDEGGTTFTLCDECWDKEYKKHHPIEQEKFKRKHKYIVWKLDDVNKYLNKEDRFNLDLCSIAISQGRFKDGKKNNKYVVVNEDEPYSEQVWRLIENSGDQPLDTSLLLTDEEIKEVRDTEELKDHTYTYSIIFAVCKAVAKAQLAKCQQTIREQVYKEVFSHLEGAIFKDDMIDRNSCALIFPIKYLESIGQFPVHIGRSPEAKQ
jgi:hypothetical protein